MIRKLMHIVKGWSMAWGIVKTSTAEAKLSELRLKICGTCPYSTSSKILEILNGNANYEYRLQCTKCSCPCLEKSLIVDETCPIMKW